MHWNTGGVFHVKHPGTGTGTGDRKATNRRGARSTRRLVASATYTRSPSGASSTCRSTPRGSFTSETATKETAHATTM